MMQYEHERTNNNVLVSVPLRGNVNNDDVPDRYTYAGGSVSVPLRGNVNNDAGNAADRSQARLFPSPYGEM